MIIWNITTSHLTFASSKVAQLSKIQLSYQSITQLTQLTQLTNGSAINATIPSGIFHCEFPLV